MQSNLVGVRTEPAFGIVLIIDTLVSIPFRDCQFSIRRPCSVNLCADNAAIDGAGSMGDRERGDKF